MPTGYEISMYRDIGRIVNQLERTADMLEVLVKLIEGVTGQIVELNQELSATRRIDQ